MDQIKKKLTKKKTGKANVNEGLRSPASELAEMDALKKFVNKKKADKKFKNAGPGHRLNSTPPSPAGSSVDQKSTPKKPSPSRKVGPSEEKKAAAEAALARLQQKKSHTDANEMLANRQLKFIQEQARKEIEAENRLKAEAEEAAKSGKKVPPVDSADNSDIEDSNYSMHGVTGKVVDSKCFAVNGVFFTCPIIGPAVGTRAEIEKSIYEFLLEQVNEDIGVTSCLLIHSCNKGRDRIQIGIDTLCKYLDNIIKNPNEPKYRKIRCSNKVFQERVANLKGATEFLQAAGFAKVLMKPDGTPESPEEDFWVYEPGENPEAAVVALTELRDSLQSTTPIKPELDRNVQVLMPAEVVSRKELPADFYQLTGEELKKEQRLRSEIAERELRLRTKAQRERDELREQRLYKFCLMRIRFPDGFTLQGTFYAMEKVGDVYAFVQENLSLDDIEFSLKKSGGETLSDLEATLAEMRLAPATILNFKLEKELPPSVVKAADFSFLRPELLALVQPMA